jgi:hypothetical protein
VLEPLARLGYAAKAVIYAIVGTLAILTAVNRGGAITDTSGALRVVLRQPFGRLLLIALAIGLCGYAIWRWIDAIADPDGDGSSAGGLMVRIGNMARGLVYGALGLEAIQLLRGAGGSNGNDVEFWTARLLAFPFGVVLVGIVGLILGAYGVSEIIKAVRGTDAKIDWSPVHRDVRPVVQAISRFGVAVRGGLLITLGVFLVRAAFTSNPNEAADPRESFLRLGGLIDGRWFLALLAAGLVAYAVDQAVHARCRRIRAVL